MTPSSFPRSGASADTRAVQPPTRRHPPPTPPPPQPVQPRQPPPPHPHPSRRLTHQNPTAVSRRNSDRRARARDRQRIVVSVLRRLRIVTPGDLRHQRSNPGDPIAVCPRFGQAVRERGELTSPGFEPQRCYKVRERVQRSGQIGLPRSVVASADDTVWKRYTPCLRAEGVG